MLSGQKIDHNIGVVAVAFLNLDPTIRMCVNNLCVVTLFYESDAAKVGMVEIINGGTTSLGAQLRQWQVCMMLLCNLLPPLTASPLCSPMAGAAAAAPSRSRRQILRRQAGCVLGRGFNLRLAGCRQGVPVQGVRPGLPGECAARTRGAHGPHGHSPTDSPLP